MVAERLATIAHRVVATACITVSAVGLFTRSMVPHRAAAALLRCVILDEHSQLSSGFSGRGASPGPAGAAVRQTVSHVVHVRTWTCARCGDWRLPHPCSVLLLELPRSRARSAPYAPRAVQCSGARRRAPRYAAAALARCYNWPSSPRTLTMAANTGYFGQSLGASRGNSATRGMY